VRRIADRGHGGQVATRLPAPLRDSVLERLGFSTPPAADLAGLRAVYARWCQRVPFDNLRKMIALRAPDVRPMPGLPASDFFDAWLAAGCGGTCWPTSNALWSLLADLGFDARRVAGSMRDIGVVGHGTVIVTLDGREWLVDSSLLTLEPIPVDRTPAVVGDPLVPVEVERDGQDLVVWFDALPSADPVPCRLLVDPADTSLYEARYEWSRGVSPFNQRVYARRHLPGRATVLMGHTLFTRTANTRSAKELEPAAICDALVEHFGISEALIARWGDCGALADSTQPATGPPPPQSPRRPPSRRHAH
jgi:N-hydroxyarylamine O-acetyltransferase